jgi:hypothetical protein
MRITGVEVLAIPDRGDSMMLVLVDTDADVSGIGRIAHLEVRRRDRLGAVLHEYQHTA